MARRSKNPTGQYFDGNRGQVMHFEYTQKVTGSGGREAYRLSDGRWLSGVRKGTGNLLKRRTTKSPPRWAKQPNSPKHITRSDYPAVFGDTDQDSIPDVDDPHPFEAGDERSIEEVRLSDEIGELIDTRESFTPAMDEVMGRLEALKIPGSKVQGRVKTPYSIINKLRRKRLGTLTDVAATRIIVPDKAGVDMAAAAIEGGFEVMEKEDFYKKPQAGYRALHYIVKANGVPVEVQIKTRRMSEISGASHTAYKRGVLDPQAMDQLTDLAARADAGDKKAQGQIDPLLRNKGQLRAMLTRKVNPRVRRLANRMANGY